MKILLITLLLTFNSYSIELTDFLIYQKGSWNVKHRYQRPGDTNSLYTSATRKVSIDTKHIKISLNTTNNGSTYFTKIHINKIKNTDGKYEFHVTDSRGTQGSGLITIIDNKTIRTDHREIKLYDIQKVVNKTGLIHEIETTVYDLKNKLNYTSEDLYKKD